MAVRIVLPDGETTFTYATSAVARGGNVGIYEWNDQARNLQEIASLRADAFVRIDVIKDRVVIQTIPGRAQRPPALSNQPTV
jgi:arginine repressor